MVALRLKSTAQALETEREEDLDSTEIILISEYQPRLEYSSLFDERKTKEEQIIEEKETCQEAAKQGPERGNELSSDLRCQVTVETKTSADPGVKAYSSSIEETLCSSRSLCQKQSLTA